MPEENNRSAPDGATLVNQTCALTDAQVGRLSEAIAASVCRNMSGMGHMREQVESLVWSELAGTPALGGAPAGVDEWADAASDNATSARDKLADATESLDAGNLRHASELAQSAASELRTAAVFDYVARKLGDVEAPS